MLGVRNFCPPRLTCPGRFGAFSLVGPVDPDFLNAGTEKNFGRDVMTRLSSCCLSASRRSDWLASGLTGGRRLVD